MLITSVFAIILMGLGCTNSKPRGSDIPLTAVTFVSAEQIGGTEGTADSTGLTLTFSADPTTLTVDNITVTGATKGTLSGSGTTRTLAISGITVGNGETVSVAIANPSGYTIIGSPKTAVVYKDPTVIKTVNASGGADFPNLNAALVAVESGVRIDIILLVGSVQHSYPMTQYMTSELGYTLVIRGAETDPDKFPIIQRTSQDYYNFLGRNSVRFENLIFEGNTAFDSGDPTGRLHSFKNCIIRNFTGTSNANSFYLNQGGGSTEAEFINCLFVNNARVFAFNRWNSHPTFRVINCTFDGNAQLFSNTTPFVNNFSFMNCIFSNNTVTFPDNTMRARVTHSLTSEPISAYGTGCVSSPHPRYVEETRTNPSDWRIAHDSPAKNMGVTIGAPFDDIAGNLRYWGAGCWFE